MLKEDESGRRSRKNGRRASVSWEATAIVQACSNRVRKKRNARDMGKDKVTGLSDEKNVQRLANQPKIRIPSSPAH